MTNTNDPPRNVGVEASRQFHSSKIYKYLWGFIAEVESSWWEAISVLCPLALLLSLPNFDES
jgi:hypothetical protein